MHVFRDGPLDIHVLDSDIPLSDAQWTALIVGERRRREPQRCNFYRTGYGTCCKPSIHILEGTGAKRSHSYLPIPTNPTTRQDTDMPSLNSIRRELEALDEEEARVSERKEKLLAQLERIQARPKEPEEGTVVSFKVQFDPHGIVYKFAAIRAGHHWYTTSGNFPGPYKWSALIDLMERDHAVKTGAKLTEYHIATEWKRSSW